MGSSSRAGQHFKGDGSSSSSADEDPLVSKGVYKFDDTGKELKTCLTCEIDDIKLQYYSDGEKAVCVTDGPVYSGTTDQFDMEQFHGADTYVETQVGNLYELIKCIDTVARGEKDGQTVYTLTLDPQKYIETDEIYKMMADSGDAVQKAVVIVAFNKDGYIVMEDLFVEYPKNTAQTNIVLSDFDSTTIEAMPEATRTYEEMDADITKKWELFEKGAELTEDLEALLETSSSSSSKKVLLHRRSTAAPAHCGGRVLVQWRFSRAG